MSTRAQVRFIAPLTALGVVFGDIGTSPLYSVNSLFYRSGSVHTPSDALGATSLIIWILTIVICFKYVSVVLRADNHEQGGVFALLALLRGAKARGMTFIGALLVFAAGMLLGDGVITPAISVLSAVEGLEVATPSFRHYTVAITLLVLVALFVIQSRGTGKIGRYFGPIMLIWFYFLGLIGFYSLVHNPEILRALNPVYAIEFLAKIDLHALTYTAGSVVLVVTGGEALFADLGHIGRRPIRQAWWMIVYPALMLNYLGQGAYFYGGNEIHNQNIMFSMIPSWSIYPSVILATLATVIASQALITGAYSLVAQGIALKYLPKLRILHTDENRMGQTYIPFVNWALFVGCVFLVVTFKSSEHLEHAYGLAVSADMVITTIAVSAVARLVWRWNIARVLAVFIPFALIDATLFFGNVTKIPTGGYIPLTIGIVMVTIMSTWKWGRQQVREAFMDHSTMTMGEIIAIKQKQSKSFNRPIVMLTVQHPISTLDSVPPLLEVFYKRYGALPHQLVLLSIQQKSVPYVRNDEKYHVVEFEHIPQGGRAFLSILAQFGFREHPDVESVIADITRQENLPDENVSEWMIHAGRDRIVVSPQSNLWLRMRFSLFSFLSRQAEPAYSYFGLDDDARLTVEFVPVKLK